MNLIRPKARTSAPPPEHGDWRVPLERPEEAEHLPPPPDIWRRMRLRVDYWQAGGAAGAAAVAAAGEGEDGVVPIAGAARALRLCLAWLLLMPLSVVMVYALLLHLYHHAASTVGQLKFWLSEPVWYSLLGAGAFAALTISRVVQPVLIYVYVLGHELTHAVAAVISFGRVQTLRIDLDGGYVETDADNLFIALSPYFVPLWMCCWLLVLWSANALYPFPEWRAWFYAGLGFWWSFHLYWTLWVIPREQPDMLENGLLFSLLLILVMNIGILLVILYCFGLLAPVAYAHDCLSAAKQIYESLSAAYAALVQLATAGS